MFLGVSWLFLGVSVCFLAISFSGLRQCAPTQDSGWAELVACAWCAQAMVERSMKGHMDPDYGGKVRGLKYSYSMKRHMDPDYGGKVSGA